MRKTIKIYLLKKRRFSIEWFLLLHYAAAAGNPLTQLQVAWGPRPHLPPPRPSLRHFFEHLALLLHGSRSPQRFMYTQRTKTNKQTKNFLLFRTNQLLTVWRTDETVSTDALLIRVPGYVQALSGVLAVSVAFYGALCVAAARLSGTVIVFVKTMIWKLRKILRCVRWLFMRVLTKSVWTKDATTVSFSDE